jgi:membrane fusion protein
MVKFNHFIRFQRSSIASDCNNEDDLSAYCEGSFFQSTMQSSLFRTEVTQAKQASWLGSIHLAHKPQFSLIACIALALAGALVAFGAWGKVARKVRITGVLVPPQGMLELSAGAAGVLSHIAIQQGQPVSAGQTLFVFNTDKVSSHGSTTALLDAQLSERQRTLLAERQARQAQHQLRVSSLASRFRTLGLELVQSQQEQALLLRRVELSQKTWRRYQQMSTEGFVSEIQSQNKQEELLDLNVRQEVTQRNILALQREQDSTHSEQLSLVKQFQIELNQLDRTLASLQQELVENQSRKSSSLIAPQPGVVSTLHVPLGAFIQAGQTVASFIPQASPSSETAQGLIAYLYAPTRTSGFVKPGQAVWMRLSAYPYQKFGLSKGFVTQVSGTPIAPQDLPHGLGTALLASAQSSEPLYRIQVQLDAQHMFAYNESHPLKPGMTLEADVVQDIRQVWQWVFEPLLAIHAKTKMNL